MLGTDHLVHLMIEIQNFRLEVGQRQEVRLLAFIAAFEARPPVLLQIVPLGMLFLR